LLATQNQKIVEGHTGDKFWGGKVNHLGNILMRVRDEVRIQRPAPALRAHLDVVSTLNAKPRQKGDSNRHALFQSRREVWLDVDESPDASSTDVGDAEVGAQHGHNA